MNTAGKRTIAYILIVLVIFDFALAALNPKATGYDISIYYAFPIYFWIAVCFTYFLAIVVMLQNIRAESGRLWWLGFLSFIGVNFLNATLPLFRGYYFYGLTDPGQHVGWAEEIYSTGHFLSPDSPVLLNRATFIQDIYPAAHTLVASFSMITNLPLLATAMLFPAIFLVVYCYSFYFCAERIFNSKLAARMIAPFGLIILFWYQSVYLPEIMAFELLPLCVFIFFLPNEPRVDFLLAVLLIAIAFYHPFDALMIYGVLFFINYGLRRYRDFPSSIVRESAPGTETIPRYRSWQFLTPALIVWILWFSATIVFAQVLTNRFRSQSQLQQYTGYLANVSASLVTGIQILGFQLVQDIVLVLGAIVIITLVFRTTQFKNSIYRALILPIPVLLLITAVGVVSPVAIDFRRTLTYTTFVSELVLGLGVFYLFSNTVSSITKRRILVFLCVILLVLSAVSVFNFHESPFASAHNDQITFSEIHGMIWFLQNQNPNLLIYNPYKGAGMYQYVDAAIIYGMNNIPSNIRIGTGVGNAPNHYGYDSYPYFGDTSNSSFYFISNSFAVVAPSVLIPQFRSSWAFTPQDWNRLTEHDPTADLPFNNGGFFLFYVSPPT